MLVGCSTWLGAVNERVMEAHSLCAALPLLHAALRTFDFVLHHHRLTAGESDTGLAAITKGFEAAGETVPDVLVDVEREPFARRGGPSGAPSAGKALETSGFGFGLGPCVGGSG